MVSLDTFREIALSCPEATEDTHFDKISFRIKKKIFGTYDSQNNQACFKLSLVDQDLYSLIDKKSIYAVPNSWGKQGWTITDLNQIPLEIFREVVQSAYCQVAPQKLANQYFNQEKI
ncbi:MAG: MmcQ/YjbR family DNA-binding protein [Sphingobacterium composti]|uniref:MmcQ/YjbR family DNA-binding protein n=1 Tax=Sphingobacterium composti TaxID=363260 RepID=UPI001356CBE8|nr:MmcQ/YjbR family DNA-binding protein [Sphingobacterium composti Ten et al. 2007 non Yoo et al. 2007]